MVRQSVTAWVVREGFAEWTTLRTSKGVVEKVGGGRWMFTPETGFPERLRQERPLPPLPYVLAAPSTHALMRVADLPTVDAGELNGMIELQIDKFSPYPVDQMKYSGEVLRQENDQSRVVMAAIELSSRERIAEPFREIGRLPVFIDAEPLVWWSAVQAATDTTGEGRHLHLILHAGGADVIAIEDGLPVLFRLLVTRPADAAADAPWPVEDLAEEMEYSLRAVEADWGGRDIASLTVWQAGDPPADLMSRLKTLIGRAPQTAPLDRLPSLSESMARRVLSADSASHLNLADEAWMQATQTRRLRKRLGFSALALAAVWLVAVGVFLGLESWQKANLAKARADLTALQVAAKDVRQIRTRVESLKQYGARQRSALECLREICALLPDKLEISQFQYHKGDRLNMRGTAPETESGRIYDFFEAIGKSAVLGKVDKQQESVITRNGARMREFSAAVSLPGASASPGGPEK